MEFCMLIKILSEHCIKSMEIYKNSLSKATGICKEKKLMLSFFTSYYTFLFEKNYQRWLQLYLYGKKFDQKAL